MTSFPSDPNQNPSLSQQKESMPLPDFNQAMALHDGEKVQKAITILRPIDELFHFLRDFKNLPKFMRHLKAVEEISPRHHRWTWKSIAGIELNFETELIAEEKGRVISWQTVPASTAASSEPVAGKDQKKATSHVKHAGSIWFKPAPQDGATEIYFQMLYRVPGGKLTKLIAELFGEEPGQVLREDLRRLRMLMETGEIATIEGQPRGAAGILH
jgi:uncharacterized membrane protein